MTVAKLTSKPDHDLFSKLYASTHALNHLLPTAKNCDGMRTRGHSTNLHEKSFASSCIYPVSQKRPRFYFLNNFLKIDRF